jgi:hypothetical protein
MGQRDIFGAYSQGYLWIAGSEGHFGVLIQKAFVDGWFSGTF